MKHLGRTFSLFLMVLCLAPHFGNSQTSVTTSDPLKKKYPNAILGSHYGILKDSDIGSDPPPYSPWAFDTYWQCFPVSTVKVTYDTERAPDPMGAANKIVTMCYLGIDSHNGELWNEYGERRAHEQTYCKEFVRAWKRLTRGQSFVCFSGEPASQESKMIDGKRILVRGWIWSKFKTRLGCYAYFPKDCFARSSASR